MQQVLSQLTEASLIPIWNVWVVRMCTFVSQAIMTGSQAIMGSQGIYDMGYHDFAGSGVVHLLGGTAG